MMKPRWYWVYMAIMTLALVLVGCVQDAGTNYTGEELVSNDIPSVTPLPTNTFTPSPTSVPTLASQSQDTVVVPQSTPFGQQLTPVVQTQDLGSDTGIQQVGTPLLTPQSGDDAGYGAVATQIVIDATSTMSVAMTGTAIARGIGFTPTPTVTPTSTQGGGPVIGQDCYHEIITGENLFKLSQRYGLTVNQLAAANGIPINNIDNVAVAIVTVGQSIRIPNCGTTGNVPPPTSTSAPTRTPVGFFPTAGVQPTVGVVQPPAATSLPVSSGRVHIVAEGETLFDIAQQYGVTLDDLVYVNNLPDANRIIMGQELLIPQQR